MAPNYAPDPNRGYSIGVIGGGIGGLCTAIGREYIPGYIYGRDAF